MNVRIQQIAQIGGVNSMSRFAASWQRAVGFHEVAPVRPSFRLADDEDVDSSAPYVKKDVESSPEQQSRSLLREAFENYERRLSDHAIDTDLTPHEERAEDEVTEHTPLRGASSSRVVSYQNIPASWADSMFSLEPSLASGFGGSYGTMYASRASRAQPRPVNISEVFRDEAVKLVPEVPSGEEESQAFIIKQIEEQGVTYNVVVGQSTLPQTVFNSVNVLIGVGLLSLPLGLLYSGWVIGLVFLCFSAVATQYTAKLLAKCLDVDNSLITFADLAYVSFGPGARVATSVLFCLELIAACVALVILFADSLSALLPGLYAVTTWKAICGAALIPLSFLPLRLLSFTSVLGILCCLSSMFPHYLTMNILNTIPSFPINFDRRLV
jgi:solute carrier family 32 (vesicular inhibitory amino acid transporter)